MPTRQNVNTPPIRLATQVGDCRLPSDVSPSFIIDLATICYVLIVHDILSCLYSSSYGGVWCANFQPSTSDISVPCMLYNAYQEYISLVTSVLRMQKTGTALVWKPAAHRNLRTESIGMDLGKNNNFACFVVKKREYLLNTRPKVQTVGRRNHP